MAKSYISKILPKDGYNSYEVIIVTDFAKVKKEMLNKKVWAVVGATAKQDRYGYKIWKKLKEHGYTSYAVNPSYKEIDGEKVYPSLSHIDESIDVVDMVVSPKISLNILDEIEKKGIQYVFFQPGSYNDEVVKKAGQLGLKYITEDCIYATLTYLE